MILTSVGLGIPVLWCTGLAVAVSLAGAPNPSARGDAAVVLGAAVWNDKPSPVFGARIDHAIKLYRNGQVKKLIFTGGMSDGDSVSEAEAARQYALNRGIPGDAILIENRSKSTVENLANAQAIMQNTGLKTVVIISDPYHLKRAGIIAGKLDLAFICSPTETSRYTGIFAKAGQLARETYFISRFLLVGN